MTWSKVRGRLFEIERASGTSAVRGLWDSMNRQIGDFVVAPGGGGLDSRVARFLAWDMQWSPLLIDQGREETKGGGGDA